MTNSFRQLNIDERRIIAQMVHNKVSQSQIARSLGRDRSTIHREIKRNFWHDKEYRPAQGYWHVTAQSLAEKRRRSYRKLHCYPLLRDAVIDRFKAGLVAGTDFRALEHRTWCSAPSMSRDHLSLCLYLRRSPSRACTFTA